MSAILPDGVAYVTSITSNSGKQGTAGVRSHKAPSLAMAMLMIAHDPSPAQTLEGGDLERSLCSSKTDAPNKPQGAD